MQEYTAWANVPGNLKTKTGLREAGLKPSPGQEAAAVFHNKFNGNRYPLYEVSQATPRPPVSEVALARLKAARAKLDQLRYCDICKGDSLSFEDYGLYKKRGRLEAGNQYRCRFCKDKLAAVAWAAAALADEQAVILDTETTGLSEASQVIEVSVIDISGNVLFNSLCRHCLLGQIPSDASRVHGITDEMLATAPTFPEIYEDLKRVLQRASRVIVYNAEYDARLLNQTRQAWGLPDFESASFDCAMLPYAAFVGEWNDYHGNYRWQKLTTAARRFGVEVDGAHRALDDARMALEVIRGMAKMARNGVDEAGVDGAGLEVDEVAF